MRALFGLVLLACGGERDGPARLPTPLERTVADGLRARYGLPFAVTCASDGRGCMARAGESALPIRIVDDGPARDWRVDGMVVRADAIEDYLRRELADLGQPTTAHCGRRLWVVQTGERVTCELAGGGKAFAVVQDDGSTRVEIQLDGAAAAVRLEPLDPARERELTELSRSYDEEVPAHDDAGAASDDAVPDE